MPERKFASVADSEALEQQSWESRDVPRSMYEFVTRTKENHGATNAFTFQLTSGPKDPAETLTWNEVHAKVTQAANLFRSLGVGRDDVVAYVLPNCSETLITLLGGPVAGIVNPINPMLEPEHIAAILRETKAKVVVTLKAFPQTDIAQKTAEAVKHAPGVTTVLEVDLNRYLTPPKSWIVPLVRPKNTGLKVHHAITKDFNRELAKQPTTLTFEDSLDDRVAAYFHTGGTTGMPKVAQHTVNGIVYNGWVGATLLFTPEDNVICPLPLFHVFGCHVIVMAAVASGAHVVFPTPAGYRGDGVFDNFWKLVERWKITFAITVPTAISALMQRPVDADVSTIKTVFSGSAALPVELYKRFEKATGVTIVEGYGLTEATCLVSCNPAHGKKKIGSVGIRFPYTDIKILHTGSDGAPKECAVDEVGEICVANPGVYAGSTYTEEDKNHDLFHYDRYLRTGDLGRIDADGYLFITGRAKDLIIRGGHNIDPAEIEEALAGHPAVAFAGAIGQPDKHAGELPCAYVELIDGGEASVDELMAFVTRQIHERAAVPKYLEVLDELPKTAVGKVFKPDLRKRAITRVYNEALAEAGLSARVVAVIEDKKRGLVAQIDKAHSAEGEKIEHILGEFTRPWEFTA
ncbi:acyl-CoA synthetase [Aliiroseovarius sp. PTFE2010]|uniref:acyl-CoA synthetase n=1 Tax=Aliiroseovarius sp. PTFE2010 TaxID=3417190 RepID=UPI003CF61117